MTIPQHCRQLLVAGFLNSAVNFTLNTKSTNGQCKHYRDSNTNFIEIPRQGEELIQSAEGWRALESRGRGQRLDTTPGEGLEPENWDVEKKKDFCWNLSNELETAKGCGGMWEWDSQVKSLIHWGFLEQNALTAWLLTVVSEVGMRLVGSYPDFIIPRAWL